MIAFLFFLILPVLAGTESQIAFEKSYPRDNTFCYFNKKRVEILIRGSSKFVESKDKRYGELIFYRPENKLPFLLSNIGIHSDTFRFFLGKSPYCSKSHGYMIDSSTLAVLLLKENKPFKDKLAIQLFDINTIAPKEFIETDFTVDQASKSETGFAIRTFTENYDRHAGKVMIETKNYIYQEKEFPYWKEFNEKTFINSIEMTYKKFPFKKFFKDLDDFKVVTGWSETEKKFNRDIFYLAVNYQLRKRCFLFLEKRQKVSGNESWRCQTI
jgi:hypothetical protein